QIISRVTPTLVGGGGSQGGTEGDPSNGGPARTRVNALRTRAPGEGGSALHASRDTQAVMQAERNSRERGPLLRRAHLTPNAALGIDRSMLPSVPAPRALVWRI